MRPGHLILRLGQVSGEAGDGHDVLPAQRVREGAKPDGVAGMQNKVATLGRQRLGDRLAEPARRAGDQRTLAGQLKFNL